MVIILEHDSAIVAALAGKAFPQQQQQQQHHQHQQQQQDCLLITRLPAELRELIYHFVFSHSLITYYNPKGGVTFSPSWPYPHRSAQFFTNRNDASLLVTCRQLYGEAHPVYWQQVVVDCDDEPERMHAALSPVARANIQHMLSYRTLRLGAGDLLASCFFPRLRTFRLRSVGKKVVALQQRAWRLRAAAAAAVAGREDEKAAWEDEKAVVGLVTDGRGGRDVLARDGLDGLADRVSFTQQVYLHIHDEEKSAETVSVVCFINLSTDRMIRATFDERGHYDHDLGHRTVAEMKRIERWTPPDIEYHLSPGAACDDRAS